MPCVYSPVDFKLWHIFSKVNTSLLERVVLLHVFGDRGSSGIFITNDDIVYGVGSNIRGIDPFKAFSYKQEMFGFLGIGETVHTNSPIEIPELSGCGIICFTSGLDHTMALSKCGDLWVWGRNNFHQLGNYHRGTINKPFLKMKGQVKAISSGDNYSLILLSNNRVMHWGSLLTEKEAISEPTVLEFPHNVIIQEISCGSRHAAALTMAGEVYLWGQNKEGQLGHGFVKGFYDVPVLMVEPEPKVISIGCGAICTFVLYENGEIGSCGCVGDLCKFKEPVKEFIITNREQILCVHTHSNYHYFNVISDNKTYGIRPLTVKGKNWQNVFGGRCTPQFLRRGIIELPPSPPAPQIRDIGNTLFDCKDHSDLTVRLKDGEVYVHKLIMRTFCKHFDSLLSGAGESIELLDIQVYNPKSYRAFLKYIYTGSVEQLDILELTELYGIALSYSEYELKQIVLYLYQLQLNVENISVAYALAHRLDYDQLIEICRGFASSFLDRVTTTNDLEDLTIELGQILLTVNTVASTYALAYNASYTKLKELCCKFASSNWEKVILSSGFEELPPELSRSLIKEAAQFKSRQQLSCLSPSFES